MLLSHNSPCCQSRHPLAQRACTTPALPRPHPSAPAHTPARQANAASLASPACFTSGIRKCARVHENSSTCAVCHATQQHSAADESFPELLRVATMAAQAGAKVVSDGVDQPRKITMKGATDLVTETDRLSEEAVLGVISRTYPGHGWLGEEGGVAGNPSSEFLWVIDPIDGTTNYAHGYPSFAVSVGILLRGEPVVGCVIEFLGGPQAWGTRTFTAHKGGGAFCNGKQIHTSSNPHVNRSLLVTGFGYDHGAAWLANMELFRELTHVSQAPRVMQCPPRKNSSTWKSGSRAFPRGVRRLGAAAVDLCHVALGIVDATWEYQLKPWDVSAGCVVLQEAGGRLTTMDGQPYSVFSRSLLGSNGPLHPEILEYTKPKTERLLQENFDLSPWFVPPGDEIA